MLLLTPQTDQELSSRTGLKTDVVQRLRGIFERHAPIQNVLLYGSRAKGNWRPESDIDLTIDSQGMTWTEFQAVEREIDDLLLPWKVDLSLYRHIEGQDLKEHIERVGLVLYSGADEPTRSG